eukprot:gnl/TRDRNA2_/TRDRNA2_149591_c1_seq1.p1 gnl/TRDRNA2_/TRDRNA2_149591_c1~~gnl/TRDRNA2_/TRDRNA2_149591_c1_seq1.p1  ORF type:complete len:323 (-),score=45.67 gnl/TRDRNA2_/TRDRNA2_149591_c1_seq1:5-850(-)
MAHELCAWQVPLRSEDAQRVDELWQLSSWKKEDSHSVASILLSDGHTVRVSQNAPVFSERGDSGEALWTSSLLLADYIRETPSQFANAPVLMELGSGCGLPGLAAASIPSASPRRVILTDYSPEALSNLLENVRLNEDAIFGALTGAQVAVEMLDWNAPHEALDRGVPMADVVIGADCLYSFLDGMPDLFSDVGSKIMQNNVNIARALSILLRKPHGTAYLMASASRRGAIDKFIAEAKLLGLRIAISEPSAHSHARVEYAPGASSQISQVLLTVRWTVSP